MRVISGKYRGKKLLAPEGQDVRPTIDRIKESIFNVIQFDIEGSIFVDLFSGTGSMGIEAVSRGANEVVFSDKALSSLEYVKKNLKGIEGNYRILNRDYRETLNSLQSKVDFIFVDAPFVMDCINDICEIVLKKDALKNNGYIIYEHDINKTYTLSNDFYFAKRKTFGKVMVDYISKTKTICAITGSFDPITIGHMYLIEKAKKQYDKVVVLVAQNEAKESLFSLKQRQKIIRLAVKNIENISVEICEGYVFQYLNENKIDIIVRGYRNDIDKNYEEEMANYNLEHGKVRTILIEAENDSIDVSSTEIREKLFNNESIIEDVPFGTASLIIKMYKELKK